MLACDELTGSLDGTVTRRSSGLWSEIAPDDVVMVMTAAAAIAVSYTEATVKPAVALKSSAFYLLVSFNAVWLA